MVGKFYPPPKSRHTQALRFTAGDLLRCCFEDEKSADIETPDYLLPPFHLEPLRILIEANTARVVAMATGKYDDQRELVYVETYV